MSQSCLRTTAAAAAAAADDDDDKIARRTVSDQVYDTRYAVAVCCRPYHRDVAA